MTVRSDEDNRDRYVHDARSGAHTVGIIGGRRGRAVSSWLSTARAVGLYASLKQSKDRGLGHGLRKIYNATLPPKLHSTSRLEHVIRLAPVQTPRVLMLGSNLHPTRLPSGARCVQIDIQRMPHIQCRCDAERLPFRDGDFDIVVATSMLEHTYHPWLVLPEMVRVCKRGAGLIYIAVPWQFPLHGEPHDFWRFSMPGLQHLCRDLDLVEAGSEASAWAALTLSLAYGFSRLVSFNRKSLAVIGLWVGKWLVFPLSVFEPLVHRRSKRSYPQDAMLYVICRVPASNVQRSPATDNHLLVPEITDSLGL